MDNGTGSQLYNIFITPYFNNFDKRIIKKTKIYFYDTGLLCYLLGINNEAQLVTHKLMGSLFENFVINEKLKIFYNRGTSPSFYFWQDSNGKEVDLIYEDSGKLPMCEIKSSSTAKPEFYKNLTMLENLAKKDDYKTKKYLYYTGELTQVIDGVSLLHWKSLSE